MGDFTPFLWIFCIQKCHSKALEPLREKDGQEKIKLAQIYPISVSIVLTARSFFLKVSQPLAKR